MSETLKKICALVRENDVRISAHGYDELAEDDIRVRAILASIETAILLEDYPDFHKGASVLVLQQDNKGNPVHVVGHPKRCRKSCGFNHSL